MDDEYDIFGGSFNDGTAIDVDALEELAANPYVDNGTEGSNDQFLSPNNSPAAGQIDLRGVDSSGVLKQLGNFAKQIGAVDKDDNINWGKLLMAALTGYGAYSQTQRMNANTDRNNAVSSSMNDAMMGALNRISQRQTSGPMVPMFDTGKLSAMVVGNQPSPLASPMIQQITRNAVPIVDSLRNPSTVIRR